MIVTFTRKDPKVDTSATVVRSVKSYAQIQEIIDQERQKGVVLKIKEVS